MRELVLALLRAVVILYPEFGETPLGTGFLVGVPVVSEGLERQVPVLVTARHVTGRHLSIRVRFREGTKDATDQGLDLEEARKQGDYWQHPDPGADVVAVRLPLPSRPPLDLIPMGTLGTDLTLQELDVAPGDRVLLPGLLQWKTNGPNRVVVREGTVAALPEVGLPLHSPLDPERADTLQRVYLVNADVIPGMSGSPVCLSPVPRLRGNAFELGGRLTILGLAQGFRLAPGRRVRVPGSTEAGSEVFDENSGVGVVIPASRILEVLARPEVRERLEELLAEPAAR